MSAVFRFDAGVVKVVENTSTKYEALPYTLILDTYDHNGWNITKDVAENTLTQSDAEQFYRTALKLLGISISKNKGTTCKTLNFTKKQEQSQATMDALKK